MAWTPMHSLVSVLEDIRVRFEETKVGDDLDPGEIDSFLDEIDAAFAIPDVKAVLEDMAKPE